MIRFRDISYRSKLLLMNISIVLLVVVSITTILTITASKQAISSHTASLNLLTEQATINFVTKVDSLRQHLYATSVSTGMVKQAGLLHTFERGSNRYAQARLELIVSLSKMVDTAALYKHISVYLDNCECISSDSYDYQARIEAEALLSSELYNQNTYGANIWVRSESGELFLIRDLYSTEPLRHIGKIAASIRQESLVSLGIANDTLHCTLLFYDDKDKLVTVAGENTIELGHSFPFLSATSESLVKIKDKLYIASVSSQSKWKTVGLLPMSVVNKLQTSIIKSSILTAFIGTLFGLLLAFAVSHKLSRQISRLVVSMNEVAAGNLDIVLPVESKDDIGVLTHHFNLMTKKSRELVEQVIFEEAKKRQAKYQNLEYEYRFLQWQINPHFIYNALETVNALAKLDGNDELCEMITLLSSYFRYNAETMRNRFVTLKQEFLSLHQYIDIYRHIYGDVFSVEFFIGDDADRVYLPTMIIQPLLENALIHGTKLSHSTHIKIRGEVNDQFLTIQIKDNGVGMTQETIHKILTPFDEKLHSQGELTSLGVRNVVDRINLIYGEAASLHITSELNNGTCVEMKIPLSYTKREKLHHLQDS